MSEANYLLTNKHLISNPNTQIMRVDLDGGFHVNESIPATDAAKEVLRIIKGQWLADAQATKIREQQEHITELENRLRALWDKLEGERKYYQERIKRLEEAGARAVLKAHLPDRLAAWEEANPGRVFDWNQIKKEVKP